MTKIEKLIQFYTNILESADAANLVIDEDNRIYQMKGEEKTPLLVGGKQLILPTEKWLATPNWDEVQAFHPLCENTIRNESVVFKFLRKLLVIQLNAKLVHLIKSFTHYATRSETHASLNPTTQYPLLKHISKGGDGKFSEFIDKICSNLEPSVDGSDNKLINIVITRSKALNGKKYVRVAKVFFPIVDEINEDKGSVFGVKGRKSDLANLKAYFEYLGLIQKDEEDLFSFGSSSLIAPNLHALLSAYGHLSNRLNKFNRDWNLDDTDGQVSEFMYHVNDMFNELRNAVPTLPGNEGEHDELDPKQRVDEKNAVGTQPTIVPQEQRNSQNYTPPTPIGKNPTKPKAQPKSSGSLVDLIGQQPQQPAYYVNDNGLGLGGGQPNPYQYQQPVPQGNVVPPRQHLVNQYKQTAYQNNNRFGYGGYRSFTGRWQN